MYTYMYLIHLHTTDDGTCMYMYLYLIHLHTTDDGTCMYMYLYLSHCHTTDDGTCTSFTCTKLVMVHIPHSLERDCSITLLGYKIFKKISVPIPGLRLRDGMMVTCYMYMEAATNTSLTWANNEMDALA